MEAGVKKKLGAIVIVMGLIVGVLFITAGYKISAAGDEMSYIRSIGGSTIDEAFYQEFGEMSKGIGLFVYGIGFTAIAVSGVAGGIMLLSEDTAASLPENKPTGELPSI